MNRPFVTISYAQSIDGSISLTDGKKLLLSCFESLQFIHRLRASHQAILVGIRTVVTDNPLLTVRYARGPHPQPVVVDTSLKIAEHAKLVCAHPRKLWIAAGETADEQRICRLEAHGVQIMRIRVNDRGLLDLRHLLVQLSDRGVRRLMVEGGGRIITSFLGEQLVDRVVVTIAPFFAGGIAVTSGHESVSRGPFPRLENVSCRYLGRDIVIQGTPAWGGT